MEKGLRVCQTQLRSLVFETWLAGERERHRIAVELHGGVADTLALVKMRLTTLREKVHATGIAAAWDGVYGALGQAIQGTRSVMFELSSPLLHLLGFEPAAERLAEECQEQHGILVKFENDIQSKPLENRVGLVLFRSVEELLLNAARHSQANNVEVRVRRDSDTIYVDVEDDGIGFDIFEVGLHRHKDGGFGLFNIRERLSHVGGELLLESRQAHGTLATLVAPILKDASARGPAVC